MIDKICQQWTPTGRKSRYFWTFSGLALFVLSAFLISLRCGSLKLSFPEVLHAVFVAESGISRQIIWTVRLPRTLTAALVGICLSVSGAILQGVMRNPLAAPNLIGVSSGAGLAVVGIMILFPQYFHLLVPAAFCGSFLATVLIYLLAWKQGIQPVRLILAGIAVSSMLGAMISALLILYPDRVHGVLDFLVGGLSARSWRHVNIIWPYTLIGVAATLYMAKEVNILVLGDAVAISLGIRIERTRLILLALSSLLAGAAVSIAGLLGFVGLIVPHIMRLVVGSDYRILIPACILFSSGLLMFCDTMGRVIRDPIEIPVGIIMSLLGAPFFLYLLRGRIQHAG